MITVTQAPGDFAPHSHDMAPTSKPTFSSGGDPAVVDVGSRLLQADFKPLAAVKKFAICMALIGWSFVAGSMYIAFLVIREESETNTTSFVLPIGASIIILAIHSRYEDFPPFGAFIGMPPRIIVAVPVPHSLIISLDKVAFGVQLCTVWLCSAVPIVIHFRRDIRRKYKFNATPVRTNLLTSILQVK